MCWQPKQGFCPSVRLQSQLVCCTTVSPPADGHHLYQTRMWSTPVYLSNCWQTHQLRNICHTLLYINKSNKPFQCRGNSTHTPPQGQQFSLQTMFLSLHSSFLFHGWDTCAEKDQSKVVFGPTGDGDTLLRPKRRRDELFPGAAELTARTKC